VYVDIRHVGSQTISHHTTESSKETKQNKTQLQTNPKIKKKPKEKRTNSRLPVRRPPGRPCGAALADRVRRLQRAADVVGQASDDGRRGAGVVLHVRGRPAGKGDAGFEGVDLCGQGYQYQSIVCVG